jgi:hypothetical protein
MAPFTPRTSAKSTLSGPAERRKRLNAALLIGGYAVGQGAIFAVQTLLVAQDRLLLLAGFGSVFSFAILGSLIIDFGALTVLARRTAEADGDTKLVWTSYWSITACRLAIGAGVAMAASVYAILATDEFLRAYVFWALPAAVLWPFNAAGILDGLRLGGVSGLTSVLPYLCSAVALLAAMQVSPGVAGALLGGGLTFGYALTLIGQYAALRRFGSAPRFVRPARGHILIIGREGGAVLLTTLPGQLHYRYQLLLANLVLGAAGTALFLYARQIATACAQVIGFLRRVEFPDLVARMIEARGDPTKVVLDTQRTGTRLGFAAAATMIGAGVAGHLWLPGALGEAAFATAIFGPVVLAGAISAAFVQGLQAAGLYAAAAVAMAIALAVGTGINATILIWPALVVFVAADLTLHATVFAVSRAALLRPYRRVRTA